MRKNITRGKRIFAAAAVVTAVCMTTNTVVPFMTYAYADTANIRAGAVTVTSESQLRQALQAGSSLIVVSGSITVAEDAAGTPLMIPGNVTITGADSNSELIIRGAVQLTGDHVTIQNVKLHFISTNALQSVVHREIFLAGHSLVLWIRMLKVVQVPDWEVLGEQKKNCSQQSMQADLKIRLSDKMHH